MIYVIYAFAAVFLLLCVTMIYVYFRERHVGMFLMGVTYGTAGLLAITQSHWWPLVVGFVLAWLLRMLGLEPSVEPKAEGGRRKEEGSPE